MSNQKKCFIGFVLITVAPLIFMLLYSHGLTEDKLNQSIQDETLLASNLFINSTLSNLRFNSRHYTDFLAKNTRLNKLLTNGSLNESQRQQGLATIMEEYRSRLGFSFLEISAPSEQILYSTIKDRTGINAKDNPIFDEHQEITQVDFGHSDHFHMYVIKGSTYIYDNDKAIAKISGGYILDENFLQMHTAANYKIGFYHHASHHLYASDNTHLKHEALNALLTESQKYCQRARQECLGNSLKPHTTITKGKVISVVVPLVYNNSIFALLIFERNIETFTQDLHDSQYGLLILALVYVGLLLTLAVVLGRIFLAPMKQLKEEIRNLSETDHLTGLLNRRSMYKILENEMARADRNNTSLGLVVFNINHFKDLTDQYGHRLADKIIKHVADLTLDKLRDNDYVFRIGGDEFIMILHLNDQSASPHKDRNKAQEHVLLAVERLRDAVNKNQPKIHELKEKVSICLGASIYPFDTMDMDILIKQADEALFYAKRNEKNHIILFEKSLSKELDNVKVRSFP